jgi:hypothetical protein
MRGKSGVARDARPGTAKVPAKFASRGNTVAAPYAPQCTDVAQSNERHEKDQNMTELEFQSLVNEGFNRIPMIAEALADLETPLSLYLKLAQTCSNRWSGASALGAIPLSACRPAQ